MKTFGPFRLDPVNHSLWRADDRVALTPKAFDVLRYLVERPRQLVSSEELLDALWPDTHINPEGIRKYILEVRKVLGDQAGRPEFIETLPKRGYQFVAPVMEGRAVPQSEPPFHGVGKIVGRQTGLAQLEECLQKASSAQRQVVFITGEAGIGKTTLVDTFQRELAGRDLRVARGQCIEGFGGIEPYYPMLEAIGALLQDPGNGALIETLAQRAPTWLIQFPALVKAGQRESLQREILGTTRERMVREISETLEVITLETPLILILEDLHWADPSTLDLISALARRREPAKLLLLVTYRPVDVVLSQSPLKTLKQDLLLRRLCHEIAVERLEISEVADYLAKILSNENLPPALTSLIHHNSGGNPLFMVAIVQDMVNKGLIEERGRSFALTAPVEEIYPGIPESLQQMLEIQLERLSPEEQHILQSGSVAGERFSTWAVAAMLDASEHSTEDVCDRLAARQQFIRATGIHEATTGAPSAHYEFRHALYRQALYRSLSGANRSKLHRILGERLAPICTGGRTELASELAMHFEEARDNRQAVRFLVLAAENAAKRFAYRDSIRVLRRARELASGDSEIEILQSIGDAHLAIGEMSESVAFYSAAVEKAANAGLATARVGALARLAVPAWYIDPTRGDEACRQAREMSETLDDPLLAARTRLAAASLRLLYGAWRSEDAEVCVEAQETIRRLSGSSFVENVQSIYVQAMRGEYKEALKNANALISASSNPMAYLLGRGAVALIYLFWGRLGDVLEMVRTERALAEKNGEDPWMYLKPEAWLRMLCGDSEGVRRLIEIPMRRIDAQPHAAFTRTVCRLSCGYAEIHQGRFEESLPYFLEILSPETTPPGFFLHWHWRMQAQAGVTEARLSAGHLGKAHSAADALLESALSTADPNLRARAWEMKARVARAEKHYRDAREFIEKALAIVDRFEIPLVAWHAHHTASDLCDDEGNSEKAAAHTARARELILKVADSFQSHEPLRASLLAAASQKRVLA